MNAINVTGIKPNWMPRLCRAVTELKEVVRKLGMSSHFAGSLEAEDQQIKNKTITLEDKGGELKAPNRMHWCGPYPCKSGQCYFWL